jgi:uncharacterized membrane protein
MQNSPATKPKPWLELSSISLLTLFIGLYIVLYGQMVTYRHLYFNSTGYDLGIKDQVVWNISQGRWFASSVEVANVLGDHFQPTMAVLALLYLIYPSVYWLLIFQTIVLALGAIPIYRLATRRLQTPLAGLVFAVAYLLHPAIGFINRFDFHWEAAVVLFFLIATDALDSYKPKQATLWLILALFSKEEMGLTIAAFGLTAIAKKFTRFGLSWLIIGLLTSLLTLFVIMPFIRGGPSDTLERYGWLGATPLGMVKTMLLHPIYVLRVMILERGHDIKLYFKGLFMPVMFLSFLSPLNLLPALPSMAYNLLSSHYAQRTIMYQYNSATIPFVFISAIYGTEFIFRQLDQIKIGRYFKWGILITLCINTYFTLNLTPWTDPLNWQRLENESIVYEALALIPPTAKVYTTNVYAPHVSEREYLYLHDGEKLHPQNVGKIDLAALLAKSDIILLNAQDKRFISDAEFHTVLLQAKALGFHVQFFSHGVILLNHDNQIKSLIDINQLLEQ